MAGPPPRAAVHLVLLLVQVINAGYTVLTKLALKDDHVNPLIFSFYRDALAYPVLQIACLCVDGRLAPGWRDVPRIAFLGLTGMYGNQVLYIMGLDLTNSDFAAIMQQATPVITCLIAVTLRVERLTLRKGAGISICVGGALLMVGVQHLVGRGQTAAHSNTALGALVLLGNTLCSAVYMISQKPLLLRYPPLSLTAWSYGFGALLMGGTSIYYQGEPSVWRISGKAVLALSFAVVFNSAAKYSLNSFANKHVSATVVQLWATMATLLTALFAWVLIGTKPQKQYLWGLAIVVGLFMVVLDRAKEPFEAKHGGRPVTGQADNGAARGTLASYPTGSGSSAHPGPSDRLLANVSGEDTRTGTAGAVDSEPAASMSPDTRV